MASDLISRCEEVLKKIDVKYSVVKHPAVFNTEAHKKEVKLQLGDVLAKNLFIQSKKKKLFLVVVEQDCMVDYKSLGVRLEAAGGVRQSDKETLKSALGLEAGSVTPFGILNDGTHEVEVVLDPQLLSANRVGIHPLTNEATLFLSPSDLQKFISSQGNPSRVVDPRKDDADQQDESKGDAGKKQKPEKAEKKEKVEKDKGSKTEKAGKDHHKKDKTDKEKPKTEKEQKEKAAGLGIDAKKDSQFHSWYAQVVTRSEMIDYHDISGCYILRPWSYSIWEDIQAFFDKEIKKLGVKNSYFPLFISQRALQKEKDHLEGFAPEVAWVTKAGDSELEEHIAVRPTSETIMYPAFSKWIRSHRDLPLKLNQWSNVVRWEFKTPTPFMRSREFLWQEGHSVFPNRAQAEEEVLQILDLYAQVYERLLAVPVVKGRKTEKERFAGGFYTTTIEAFIPAVGRGVQAATSHCLGTNFAEMFDITYEDDQGVKQLAWQNSWGLTTRSIGVMVMTHADDKGLVLPPRVATIQVVIVPIFNSKEKDQFLRKAEEIADILKGAGCRVFMDGSTLHRPGWKYNHWELKGVPIRLELGPEDVKEERVVAVRRDTNAKKEIKWNSLHFEIPELLRTIQREMFDRALNTYKSRVKQAKTWAEFMSVLNNKNVVVAPWCGVKTCEEKIKTQSGIDSKVEEEEQVEEGIGANQHKDKLTGAAKSLCIPFEQPELPEGTNCVMCKSKAIMWTMFGRSF